ncbi:hypothetical protein HPB47_027756, partial [Ixodes persulcatus]
MFSLSLSLSLRAPPTPEENIGSLESRLTSGEYLPALYSNIEVVVEGEVIAPEDLNADWIPVHTARKKARQPNIPSPKPSNPIERLASRSSPRPGSKPRPPQLPRLPDDDYKIVIQRARTYFNLHTLRIGEENYPLATYVADPANTSRGIIFDVPEYDTPENISRYLIDYNHDPAILLARRMGKTNSVQIVFDSLDVPHWVSSRAPYRCVLFRHKTEACNICWKIGHRADVCPSPRTNKCPRCGMDNPPTDHDSFRLVHEWAHYRYGVFDEYGVAGDYRYPSMYCEFGMVRANVCSDRMRFTSSTDDGEPCRVYRGCKVSTRCNAKFYQDPRDPVEYSVMFMPYIPG